VLGKKFVVLGTEVRGFGYQLSGYQVPDFVVSGTATQKFVSGAKGLGKLLQGVTLLNTDSNLINTRSNVP